MQSEGRVVGTKGQKQSMVESNNGGDLSQKKQTGIILQLLAQESTVQWRKETVAPLKLKGNSWSHSCSKVIVALLDSCAMGVENWRHLP